MSLELFDDLQKGAIFSGCGEYRYQLWRIWDDSKPKVMFIMLNPSTADSEQDDPTIRRCIGFARSWGYGGFYVANLFAYRATDPWELVEVNNPCGDKNRWHIRQMLDKVDKVVCAWGNKPVLKKILKADVELELIDFAAGKLYAIDLAKDGTPKHPLYLKGDLKPKRLNDQ